jgi:hypothetical protein
MASTGVQKDINELKRLVIANGFKYVPNGAGHLKLLNKKGAVVVDANGPVIMSTSASDVRAREMHIKRLLGVGALKTDPFKDQKKLGERSGDDAQKSKRERSIAAITSPEAREARHRSDVARSKAREENTQKLRARLEPFVMSLGGWDKKGTSADLGRTLFYFLQSRNRAEAFSTLDSCYQNVYTLRKGNTLSDRSVDAWSLLLDEIERAGDTVEARRTRYFELLRDALGVKAPPATQTHPEPEPERQPIGELLHRQPESGSKAETTTPSVTNGQRQPYRTPQLALKALAEMMQGVADGTGLMADNDKKRERALGIAEEILDMEIQTMLNRTTGVEVPV